FSSVGPCRAAIPLNLTTTPGFGSQAARPRGIARSKAAKQSRWPEPRSARDCFATFAMTPAATGGRPQLDPRIAGPMLRPTAVATRGDGVQFMQFGVQFFPDVRPEEKSGEAYFQEALDLAEEADRLGFAHIRIVEHYFHYYGGYSPNPIVFLA